MINCTDKFSYSPVTYDVIGKYCHWSFLYRIESLLVVNC